MTSTNDERKPIGVYDEYRQAKIERTTNWDERVVQAIVAWFEVRMNEELRIRDKESNMFSLTDSIRLLIKEAPGIEAFCMKNGAQDFLKDEVEIISLETDQEVQERLKGSGATIDLLAE